MDEELTLKADVANADLTRLGFPGNYLTISNKPKSLINNLAVIRFIDIDKLPVPEVKYDLLLIYINYNKYNRLH